MSRISCGDRSWDLNEIGASWREVVTNGIWESIPRTWDPAYDMDARHQLDQLLSRVLDAMTRNGSRKLSDSKISASIELSRLDPATVEGRGDYRYGPERMAQYLKRSDLDLIPIVCSRTSAGYRVLDGHHRLRASALAGKPVLAFVATLSRC